MYKLSIKGSPSLTNIAAQVQFPQYLVKDFTPTSWNVVAAAFLGNVIRLHLVGSHDPQAQKQKNI